LSDFGEIRYKISAYNGVKKFMNSAKISTGKAVLSNWHK
jgi:hypothetical protein